MGTGDIPKFMETGIAMIACAFPEGIDGPSYHGLLAVLYPEMSDRNLAELVAACTGKAYATVLNDAYSVASGQTVAGHEDTARVRTLLEGCGLREWLEDE